MKARAEPSTRARSFVRSIDDVVDFVRSSALSRSSPASSPPRPPSSRASLSPSHHQVFGTGTLAALTSRTAYAKFTAAHYHFYDALERRLDAAASETRAGGPTPSGRVWRKFSAELRRAEALEHDLRSLLHTSPDAHPPSSATTAYANRIAEAAETERGAPEGGPPLLLAHFYCRYLADLFGGSVLGWPTKRALRLRRVPAFYEHDEAVVAARRPEYVESVYEALNDAGAGLSEAWTADVVRECETAFKLNAEVFKEDGRDSSFGAFLGGVHVLRGYAMERIWGSGAEGPRDIFGRLVKRKNNFSTRFHHGEEVARTGYIKPPPATKK
jgi:heme oxygenase